ncbi:MAG: hypothetical protein HWE39_20205 [Oceanospirillaceae bacterium]|nr:hypothetical protein [Oceanospirillaceae bacterium]
MQSSYVNVDGAEAASGHKKELHHTDSDVLRKVASWISSNDPDSEETGFIRSSN